MRYLIGISLAFGSTLCWAMATPFAKLMVAAHIHVISALILRNCIAVLIIGSFITFIKKENLIKDFYENKSFYLPLSLFSIICHTGGYAMSLQYLTGAQGIILHYSYPLFISLASYFVVNEKPKTVEVFSSILIIIGTYIGVIGFNSIDVSELSFIGVFWSFVSISGMTALVLFTRLRAKEKGKVDQYKILFFTNLIGGLGLLMLKTVFGDWSDLANLSLAYAGINILQAVMSTVIAYVFFYAAFNYISAMLISIITSFEIIVVFIYTYLILNIEPVPSQIIGSLLIIFAISCSTFNPDLKKKK